MSFFELSTVPWALLLAFVCGYAGYYVANTGNREHHKKLDITFSMIFFGFLGSFIYEASRRWLSSDILLNSLAAVIGAICIGGLWRIYGRQLLLQTLRRTGVSHSDDIPSAWRALFEIKDHDGTQLSVRLKDGTWLQCDDLGRFQGSPNGPCTLGATGDILMYVTDTRELHGKSVPNEAVEFDQWGTEITYIPASEIGRVDFRRKKKTTS